MVVQPHCLLELLVTISSDQMTENVAGVLHTLVKEKSTESNLQDYVGAVITVGRDF